MKDARAPSPFGRELRSWRERRGISQLRLATTAAMSPRYVSFVETGRSRPSRAVVLRLAEALGVPLRDRNRMLEAAGLAPEYPERPLDDAELGGFRRIVETLLDRHDPYPAFAFDRHYRLRATNRAGQRFFPDPAGADWIDTAFAPTSPLRAAMENFPEVAWATLEVLRRESAESTEPIACLAKLEQYLEGVPRPEGPTTSSVAPTVCPRLRFGDRVVRTVTTVVRFGGPRDVTLDELRVELVFPADDESAAFFVAAAS